MNNLLLTSTLSFALAACGGASTTGGTSGGGGDAGSPTGTMSVTINGTAKAADKVTVVKQANQPIFTIAGEFGSDPGTNDREVSLLVGPITAPGSFTIKHMTNVEATYTFKDLFDGSFATSGNITVTAFSANHITGTFNFVGPTKFGSPDNVTATNGAFDVKY